MAMLLLLLAMMGGVRAATTQTTYPWSYACVTDPTTKNCADFVYRTAAIKADLTSLCKAMPFMVGCSLWDACKASNNTSGWCSPFAIVASTCDGDGMSKMKGCASYNSMCGVPGSLVPQCSEHPAMPFMPTTRNTTDAVLAVCSERAELASSVGCKACTSLMQCPQPLESLSVLCTGADSPDIDACDSFAALCDEADAEFGALCSGKISPRVDSGDEPTPAHPGHGALLARDVAVRDVLAMCATHFMDGCQHCTGEEQCEQPLAVLSKICWSMPGMADCKAFFTACADEEKAGQWPELCMRPGSTNAAVSDESASSSSHGGHA